MRRSLVYSFFSAALCGGAVALAGCSTNGMSLTGAQTATPLTTKSQTLLYVSGESVVDVYSFPKPKLKDKLSDPYEPGSICFNKAGDVWVVSNADLEEFAPLGSTPIAKVVDPNEYPSSCAIDDVTGDLAVSNLISGSDESGSVSIFKDAKGNPKNIEALPRTYFVAYDTTSDLFVDGQSSSGAFALGEVVSGTKTLTPVTLKKGTIQFPGGMQYVSGQLAVADQNRATIYQLSIKGTTATVVGTTKLLDAADIVTFSVLGSVVACLDAGNSAIEFYAYPAGGKPFKVLHFATNGGAFGVGLQTLSS